MDHDTSEKQLIIVNVPDTASALSSEIPKALDQDHPQRLLLHEEIHARPPVALWPNERVISQAYLLDPASREQQCRWIDRAALAFRADSNPIHGQSIRLLTLSPEPNRVLLKWELHGEFVTLTLFAQQESAEPAESRQELLAGTDDLIVRAGALALREAGGERLAALDLSLESGPHYQDASDVARRFHGNTVIGSVILSNQESQLWTDMQLDHAGFIRMIIRHDGVGSRQAGLAVHRLIDIETYRMMALLALPHAKTLSEPLRSTELKVAQLSEQIAKAQQNARIDVGLDAELLKEVSALAALVEGWISAKGLRFTAAEAYSELVKRALIDLHETSIPGVQSMHEFMDRRFEPAMRTCRWTVRRLLDLSDRISRTTQIIRTRIEFVNESQAQSLLVSMDRSARLQLRLQQTVEGLSIIVLTYYATGLLMYIGKGLTAIGIAVEPEIVGLVAVPLIAVSLVWIMRRRRKSEPLVQSCPAATGMK